MGTLDENGIYIYDETDSITPFHSLLNLGQSSISPAITELKDHALIKPVANAAERDKYAAEMASEGRPASPRSPLYVDRADTGQLERNRGAGWENLINSTRDVKFGGGRGTLTGGAANPGLGGLLIQAGTNVATSSPGAGVTCPYGTTFPNGVVTILTTNGHHNAAGALSFHVNEWYRDHFAYFVIGADGQKKPGVTHRCNWLAIGW